MRMQEHIVAAGAIACTLIGGMAMAQGTEEVKVQATRMIETKVVGRTDRLVPITEIALSYRVSLSGIDVTNSAGVAEAERRVSDAALAACREITRQYPTARPDDEKCAKIAADEAMVTVRNMIAAARQRPAK